jgi:hypothetical protein
VKVSFMKLNVNRRRSPRFRLHSTKAYENKRFRDLKEIISGSGNRLCARRLDKTS